MLGEGAGAEAPALANGRSAAAHAAASNDVDALAGMADRDASVLRQAASALHSQGSLQLIEHWVLLSRRMAMAGSPYTTLPLPGRWTSWACWRRRPQT